ncbi:MAG: GNAT family N-acetyltransferase [Pyrinomonadaceae bacterium]|nr:GNAT family N-acetyltransferase [Pyrinomonadaceae bacterium]
MHVTLRPVEAGDQQFLFEVYAGTRRAELDAWGWDAAQQDAFLKMQFMAQHRAYEAQYPEADHSIILLDDQPIGRLFVARSSEWIQLTDIALLPAHRNHGIGAQLIRDLLDEAAKAGLPVRLQVLKNNPAAQLYERLGFRNTGESGMHFEMERPSV